MTGDCRRHEYVDRIPGRRIGADSELLDQMLGNRQLMMIPAVLTESARPLWN
jgi:hypothetical protein